MKTGWIRVSRSHPCPVCGKRDWCCVSSQSGAVCCMRTASDRPIGNGGWLHGGVAGPPARQGVTTGVKGYEPPEFDALLWWRAVRHVLRWERLEPWSIALGLPMDALDVMGACTLGEMLAFPMHDGTGQVCGIRTRNRDGSKRAVIGSRAGVFLPTFHDHEAEPVVCEGPTDAAAALALGFWPIGRPSCLGCERHVVDTCRRLGTERVTLCADADGPGIAGARRLADVLVASRIGVRVVTPGVHKDLRDWFKAGATPAMVDVAWSQAEWRG
jgi:hypothetical protein